MIFLGVLPKKIYVALLLGGPRAGLTNVGALFGKMCGGPLPPYTVESRIESKNARPIIFGGFYVFNFIMKYR